MRYVYEHYDMYDRAAIAAYAEAHFSEDVIFAQLKLIYEDTMKKNSSHIKPVIINFTTILLKQI